MAALQPPNVQRLKWVDTKLKSWVEKTEHVTADDVRAINAIINKELGVNNRSMLHALDDFNYSCLVKFSDTVRELNLEGDVYKTVHAKVQTVFNKVHPLVEAQVRVAEQARVEEQARLELEADRDEAVIEEKIGKAKEHFESIPPTAESFSELKKVVDKRNASAFRIFQKKFVDELKGRQEITPELKERCSAVLSEFEKALERSHEDLQPAAERVPKEKLWHRESRELQSVNWFKFKRETWFDRFTWTLKLEPNVITCIQKFQQLISEWNKDLRPEVHTEKDRQEQIQQASDIEKSFGKILKEFNPIF